jgi:hypothetical protein
MVMLHTAALAQRQWLTAFISWKTFSWSGPLFRGSFAEPAVALYSGLARLDYPGSQMQQNPATPENSWTSLLAFG